MAECNSLVNTITNNSIVAHVEAQGPIGLSYCSIKFQFVLQTFTSHFVHWIMHFDQSRAIVVMTILAWKPQLFSMDTPLPSNYPCNISLLAATSTTHTHKDKNYIKDMETQLCCLVLCILLKYLRIYRTQKTICCDWFCIGSQNNPKIVKNFKVSYALINLHLGILCSIKNIYKL